MAKTHPTRKARYRRKKHIRKHISGTLDRPRMCVFRSAKHLYVQIIDDVAGQTLASASTLNMDWDEEGATGGNRAGAAFLGRKIATVAGEKGITKVVFDRNGYLYHGRLASLADAAREAGLQF